MIISQLVSQLTEQKHANVDGWESREHMALLKLSELNSVLVQPQRATALPQRQPI